MGWQGSGFGTRDPAGQCEPITTHHTWAQLSPSNLHDLRTMLSPHEWQLQDNRAATTHHRRAAASRYVPPWLSQAEEEG
jgi:hypothetical protein